MNRNVVLTTMSTCESQKLNYYCTSRENVDYYCTGVYQQEPGIKYFLSKYPIDEIIAIASDTILKNSPAIVENEPFRITDLQGKDLGEKEYYILSKRINDYINGKNDDFQKIRKSIDVTRREDISNIVYEATKDISVKSISEAETLSKVIQDRIRKDVEEKFISPDDYSKYHVEKLSQYEEIETYIHEEEKYRNYMNTVWDVKDKFNDDLNREGYLVQSLEYYKMKSLEYYSAAKAEKEVIIRLNDAIGRLMYEIKVIREKRIETEQEYAKSLIYEWLKQRKEIKPLEENQNVFLRIVSAQKNKIDNINGILDAIKGDGTADKINVYIDMQGGSRTDGYVRQAVLSILNNEIDTKVLTKEIVAINYERGKLLNEIVNESERYGINDLVAGMNAFIQYGKADLVKKYSDVVNAGREKKLVDAMVEVDEALSLCDTKRLFTALNKIKQYYSENVKCETVFSVLVEGIKRDYGKLLEGDTIDTIELIEWCMRKTFIQQALTIIESLMPTYFVKNGIVYYADSSNVEAVRNKWTKLYKTYRSILKRKDLYKWDDLDHYFVKYYGHAYLEDKETEKGKEVSHAAALLGNKKAYVEVKSLVADNNDARDLLDMYMSICDYRNDVSHASQGEERSGAEGIKERINEFVGECKLIVDRMDLSKVEIEIISSKAIGHKIREKKDNWPKKKEVNASSKNEIVEAKDEEANEIVDDSPEEEIAENIFVAEGFTDKGALYGTYRKGKARIRKENVYEIVHNGKEKWVLMNKVQIEISGANFDKNDKAFTCIPKDKVKMIEDLRNNIKKVEE